MFTAHNEFTIRIRIVLTFAVADFCPHTAFFPSDLTTAFTSFFGSHSGFSIGLNESLQ
jgi:hypothetical protein